MYYDKKEKQDFIESISNSYAERCDIIFKQSASLEQKLNKNLYAFNLEELSILFKKFKIQKNTYISRKFVLQKYFNYYRDLRIDKTNPLSQVGTEWDKQFISDKRRNLISEKDFNELVSSFHNKQDAALCQLLFEGIGTYETSEILNLKEEDIDWNDGTLNLLGDKKGERQLKVSQRCLEFLKGAIEQRNYYSNNGQVDAGTSVSRLVQNDYVIRPSNTKKNVKDEMARAEPSLINRRFGILKEFSPNFNITVKTLGYSGMMKAAIDLRNETGVPIENFKNSTHWKHIAKRFNVSPLELTSGHYYYPGVTGHINSKIINEFYDEIEQEKISNFTLVDKEKSERQEVSRKRRYDPVAFKQMIMSVYEKCAVSGETCKDVLEACHIQPYVNQESDHIQNGILLRIDIHRLFDKGLLMINEDYVIKVNANLKSDYYQSFHNQKIYLPENKNFHPSREALAFNIKR